jgi:hypothetical protein
VSGRAIGVAMSVLTAMVVSLCYCGSHFQILGSGRRAVAVFSCGHPSDTPLASGGGWATPLEIVCSMEMYHASCHN